MNKHFERSIGLFGQDKFNLLSSKTIAVFGLGGVGGTLVEALARTGVNNIIIFDYDNVDETNLNRQILYTEKDIGKSKVEVAYNRLLSVNSKLNLTVFNKKVDNNIEEILKDFHIDMICDAIDDIEGKVALAKYATEKDIPIIMSMGMANRICPTSVYVCKVNKTELDPLARKLRYELKNNKIPMNKIYAVISKEQPVKDGTKLNSIMMVPSSAGLCMASFCVSYLLDGANYI